MRHSEDLLADQPGELRAMVKRQRGGSLLAVCRSVLVRDDDEEYAGVRAVYADHCSAVRTRVRIDDPSMAFGQAEVLTRFVWDECPGQVPHECVRASIPANEVSDAA